MILILNEDGTPKELREPGSITDPRLSRQVVEVTPVVPEGYVAEFDGYDITETHATQRWNVRPKTDAEAQTVASQLTIWQSLTSVERRNLRTLANTEGPAGDAALLIEGALMSATETESRNPATKQLLGAAIQLGVVADIERARVILNDPGFSLG
jgi:hypothetical protein